MFAKTVVEENEDNVAYYDDLIKYHIFDIFKLDY